MKNITKADMFLTTLTLVLALVACSNKTEPNPTPKSNTPKTYTVTFKPNGGEGSMEIQVFTEGVSQNLTANAFTRENYIFIGWATSADGEKEYENTANTTINADMTLYAVWVGTYMTFGEWPQSVLPEGSTITVDESDSKTVGFSPIIKAQMMLGM